MEGRTGNTPSNLQVKGLNIFEPFNPRRFLLESWPFSVFPAVGSKGLPEPSRPSTHFTDGKTEAQGQTSPQRVNAGLGLWFHGSPGFFSEWINLKKGVFAGRREEGPGAYGGWNPEKRVRSREERISLKPGWWQGRGDKRWFRWKVRRFREGGGRQDQLRLVLSPDPPHEAHCSPGAGPIICFVSRQIITQLV